MMGSLMGVVGDAVSDTQDWPRRPDSSTDLDFLIFFFRTSLIVVLMSLWSPFSPGLPGFPGEGLVACMVGDELPSREVTLLTTGGLLSEREVDEDDGDSDVTDIYPLIVCVFISKY